MIRDAKIMVRALFLGMAIIALWAAFGLNDASAAIIAKPPTNLGLVGYWSMNEGAGSYAGDSSGNKNQGTLVNGPTWVDGKRGKALNFDGSNDYVDVSDSPSISITGDLTMMAWVNPRSSSGWRAVLCKRPAASHISPYCNYGLFRSNNGNFWNVRINGISSDWGTVDFNMWQHIVCSFTDSTNNVTCYKNGAVVFSSTVFTDSPQDSIYPLWIGASGGGEYFPGVIDDVRVYNRALSASEIQAFYKSGAAKFVAPPSNTGLVGYWSFDEGAGFSVTDFSGNNNRGVLTNGPTWVNGKRGKALNFDGVNDEVSVNDNNLLDITPNLSISAWIKTADTYGGIVTHVDTASPYAGYELDFGTLGTGCAPSKLAFWSGTAWKCDTGKIVNDNTWHFVSVTVSGTSGIFYIDGIQSTTFTANTIGISTQPLKIGNRTAANDFFNGLIDEVRVYNRALSAAEIQALYKSGAAKFAPPSNTGLVGYWSFDEGSGTSATDFSGNNNRGVFPGGTANPTWVDGKRGKALNFDGSNDYVNGGSNSVFDLTSNGTVSAWIKTGKNKGVIASRSRNASPFEGWEFRISHGGGSLNLSKVNFWNGTDSKTGTISVDDNNWHSVVVTFDGTNVSIYVDGSLDTQVAQASPNSFTGNLNIGTRQGSTNAAHIFNGLIDDVRVYNRALSAAEVQALYNSK